VGSHAPSGLGTNAGLLICSRIDAEPTFEVPVGIVTVATNRDTADDHQSVQADLLLPSPTDNRQHQVRLTLLIMEDFR
jgi:hypothetical protein